MQLKQGKTTPYHPNESGHVSGALAVTISFLSLSAFLSLFSLSDFSLCFLFCISFSLFFFSFSLCFRFLLSLFLISFSTPSPRSHTHTHTHKLVQAYSEMRSTILCEEDYDFFLDLCQSGGKPVNFIPVIDGSLGVWFKKDSLWYSEDLGGVPDADPHRVVVLQGPVAVHYTRQANEPAGAILDGMVAHFRKRVSAAAQAASAAPVAVTWLGGDAAVARADALGSAMIAHVAQGLEASIPAGSGSGSGSGSGLPAHAAWLAALTPGPQTWLAALLRSPAIACGHSWVDNPVLRLLAPRAGQRVLVDNATAPTALRLYDAELSSDVPVVVLKLADRQAAG